jgi:hypothetical protein
LERDFKVSSKGLKGKHHEQPFVTMTNDDGEKLELRLEAKQLLEKYEIEQEFTVKIVEGAQKKLAQR